MKRLALLAALLGPASARAEDSPLKLGAYVEANYSFNFNLPANRVTALRGFDNRHNTFTISNVAVDAAWDGPHIVGKLTLQVGHTPSTYYLAEPASPAAGGVGASGPEVFKYVQQAYVGTRFELGVPWTVTAGIFLSPIGPEGIAVKDNWSWSRSNLFYGLPFYHTGLRVVAALSDELSLTVAGYNGWSSVVDNNAEKSLTAQLAWTMEGLNVSVLYFTGVERPDGAVEGRAWRHLLDAHVAWQATDQLALLAHANAGFEPNDLGTSAWAAGALATRVQLLDPLFASARADLFYETTPAGASSIFWPVEWVASVTATLDLRPHERVSARLEYRHDHASGPAYFGAGVAADRESQDTLTLGLTTWI